MGIQILLGYCYRGLCTTLRILGWVCHQVLRLNRNVRTCDSQPPYVRKGYIKSNRSEVRVVSIFLGYNIENKRFYEKDLIEQWAQGHLYMMVSRFPCMC